MSQFLRTPLQVSDWLAHHEGGRYATYSLYTSETTKSFAELRDMNDF